MTCTHSTPEYWEWQTVEHPFTGELVGEVFRCGGKSLCEDLDIGRWRCSACGEIGYYTGLWKRFYEEGIPCPGSDSVRR
jgi:hypothetical protein